MNKLKPKLDPLINLNNKSPALANLLIRSISLKNTKIQDYVKQQLNVTTNIQIPQLDTTDGPERLVISEDSKISEDSVIPEVPEGPIVPEGSLDTKDVILPIVTRRSIIPTTRKPSITPIFRQIPDRPKIFTKPPDPPGNIISVILKNGLGNRIFQILAALGYGERNKKICTISRSLIINGRKPHEQDLENILIQIFPNIQVIDSIENYTTLKEYKEMNYSPFAECKSNVVLQGYFQDERYFPSKHFIPVIRTKYYENTVFIHIRAGDYLDQGGFGIPLVEYHKKCFKEFSPTTKYIVVSNDNLYASLYMKQFDIEYTICNTTSSLDTLVEMANCSGGICANSTFSWLGAFFQREPRGKIFMPSVWLRGRDCRGIYPTWATVIDVGRQTMLNKPPSYNTSHNIVCIKLENGLGNRLFQILAAIGYAKKYNKYLVLCKNFSIEGSKPHEQNLNEIIYTLFPKIPWVDNFNKFTTIKQDGSDSYIYTLYGNLQNVNANVLLNGAFENELYFPRHSEIPVLRTAYYENVYFIHIRAGDYLNNPTWNHDLSDYYRNCIGALDSSVNYLVFSNDNDYADNYMKQFENVKYRISEKITQLDVLTEMANCEGGICANSTFSWMGAFFQGEKRGKIFMPSVWKKGYSHLYYGIYPKWATIMTVNPIIWITMINYGYVDFTINFIESMKMNKCLFNLIVYCTDKASIDALQGYPVTCIDATVFMKYTLNEGLASWLQMNYKRIVFTKLDAIKYTLNKYRGSYVGFIDTDIIVLKDPTQTFMKAFKYNPDAEFISQCDEDKSECSNINNCQNFCSGVIVFKNTEVVQDLLEYSNKDIFNNVGNQIFLRNKANKGNIKHITISKRRLLNGAFPGIGPRTPGFLNIPSSAELIHYNYLIGDEKIEYMKKHNMWYLNEKLVDGDVCVSLSGGLGNVIFEIFAGLSYAKKFNKRYVICNTMNKKNENKAHEQNLDPMIKQIFPDIVYVDSFTSYTSIRELRHMEYDELPYHPGNILLHGFFQVEHYSLHLPYIPKIRTNYYENTYFIHIRLGDYIGFHGMDFDKSKYHRRCFNILGPDAKYIVFSNDNILADHYLKQFNIDYMISNKENALDVLIEMSNCAGGICANSTFSWMGAFFQREPRENIFVPDKWVRHIVNGIFPSWARRIDI